MTGNPRPPAGKKRDQKCRNRSLMTLLHQLCDILATTICCYQSAIRSEKHANYDKKITPQPLAVKDALKAKMSPGSPGLSGQPSLAIRCVRRETFRLADFLWRMPFRAARISDGSAATSAARAAVLSPLEMASSTSRSEVRMRERRALLIVVRRAILRVAFLADLVLAIDVP
jgi:hypothetical protein